MSVFFYQLRKAPPVELVGHFTPEESIRITHLRKRFHAHPICFKLDINYRRLEFARWLVDRGYLSEWCDTDDDGVQRVADSSADHVGTATGPQRLERWSWRCA